MKNLSNLSKAFITMTAFLCFFPLQIFSSSTIQEIIEWEIRVIKEKAKIHMEPSEDSPVVMTVPQSSILQSYEKKDDWFRVVFKHENGIVVIGYIHSSQVKAVKEKVKKKTDFWSEESDFYNGIGLTIKVSVGYNQIAAEEINDGILGIVDSYIFLAALWGDYFKGEIEPFHTGFDFSADAIFSLTPRIGIGLGLSYMQWGKLDYMPIAQPGSTRRLNSDITVNTFPVRLGLFYTQPVFKKINLTFNAGPSYYFVNHDYNFNYFPYLISQTASGEGWGLHGGIGLELVWNSRSTLFIEYQVRYAHLSAFKGKQEGRIVDRRFKEEGLLYYIANGSMPPQIAVYTQAPDGYNTVRNANYDLSGFAIRIGAKIKF
jgi:hypothetical protein